MDVQSEINGVRNWYNLIADAFDKRYEGVEGLYWENFENKIVNELVNVKGKVVLDLGCGGGRYALSVYKKAKKIIGIDISDNLIEIAKKKLRPNMPVEFHVGDATRTCFKDGYFDVIVSLGMFEYLEDPTPFLSEIQRILKPGGEFLLVCHNNNRRLIRDSRGFKLLIKPTLKRLKNIVVRSQRKADAPNCFGTSSLIRQKLYHKVRHSVDEMNGFLRQNGLEMVDYRTITFRVADKVFYIGKKLSSKRLQNALWAVSILLNRFFGKSILFKKYGGNLIVKGVKK